MSAKRFELLTNGLKGRCSAVERRARHNSGMHSNMGNIHRQHKVLHVNVVFSKSKMSPRIYATAALPEGRGVANGLELSGQMNVRRDFEKAICMETYAVDFLP